MTRPASPWQYLIIGLLGILAGAVGTGIEARLSVGGQVRVNTERLDAAESRLDRLEKGAVTAELFKAYVDHIDRRLSNIEASQLRLEKKQPTVIWGGTISQAPRAKKP